MKVFEYFRYIIIYLLLANLSCSKETPKVTSNINLLVEKIKTSNVNCICEPYLDEYIWKAKTIYVLAYKGPTCSSMPTYYNEDGELLSELQYVEFSEFVQVFYRIRNIWICGK